MGTRWDWAFLQEHAETVGRDGRWRLEAGFGEKIKAFCDGAPLRLATLRTSDQHGLPEGTHSVHLMSGPSGGPQWGVAPGPRG